jgi:ribosomal protein S18 acetylase RimI-like enzyme
MDIHQINNPVVEDFHPTIELLNKVFSKFPGYSEYSVSTAFEKTKGKDVAIFEVREEDELVGFAIGYQRYKGYYHIWQLGVSEGYRGRGIATDLYDRIEKYAKDKGYKGVTLNTFNRYKANLQLVVNRGYEIYKFDKSGLNKKDPKIFMRKVFS